MDLPRSSPDRLAAAAPDWRRVLIVAPVGRSAAVLANCLDEAGFSSETLEDVAELCREMSRGVGAVILLQEAVSRSRDLELLAQALADQPRWSDVSVHVLVDDAKRSAWYYARLAEAGYNRAIILPRPIGQATIVSLLAAAMRTRHRQYLLRDVVHGLEEAQATVAEESREMDLRVAELVHDIRSPLSTVSLALDVVDNQIAGENSERLAKIVTRARSSMRSVSGFISQFLEYVKSNSAANDEAARERIDLPALLRGVIASYSDSEVVAQEAMPPVIGDKALLGRIFENLVSNGLKYNLSAQPAVTISASQHGEIVRIDVRDNGIGVSDADKPRIFQPFERGNREQFEGTGLGLASCRQLAERMGGEIWLEESSAEGSLFSFTLVAADPA